LPRQLFRLPKAPRSRHARFVVCHDLRYFASAFRRRWLPPLLPDENRIAMRPSTALVDALPGATLFDFGGLQDELESLLGRNSEISARRSTAIMSKK